MPRAPVQLSHTVESLAILDADGNVDRQLEPRLAPGELTDLFRGMLLARRFDERLLRLQRQGRIGTFGPGMGQEAASLGPAFALRKSDWYVPSFREAAGMLYRGWPLEKIILWWGGHEEGAVTPPEMNDMPMCVPVATQCLHAAGISWASKLRGEDAVTVVFLGDGGTSEGDFHEAMNFACVHALPMFCVIQNNHWAISLPREKQSRAGTLAQKCLAYGCNGIQVDGNDILAMVAASREAAERARSGGGPTLIEAVTYRLGVHTTADDPKKYRTDEEVACWKPRDPLVRFEKYMRQRRLLDDAGLQQLEGEIAETIQSAVARAEAYRPDPTNSFRHTFAEMPASLAAQAEEFDRYLASVSAGEGAVRDPSHAAPRPERQLADAG
ncbi:MAG: pyruvate dehydrogenase (acetyl-transferring) E1 component subunit alpha [Phycisphaerae bacterium]